MTKAEIWNAAFGLLVADVEIGDCDADEGMEADLARRTYRTIYAALLEGYDWTFAMVDTASLAVITGATTADGYDVYALPSDCLTARLLFDGSGTPLRYRAVNGGLALLSSADAVNLTYVKDPGEAFLPAYFVKALEEALGARWAMPITGSADTASYWKSQAKDSLADAKSIDWQRAGQEELVDESQLPVLNKRAG